MVARWAILPLYTSSSLSRWAESRPWLERKLAAGSVVSEDPSIPAHVCQIRRRRCVPPEQLLTSLIRDRRVAGCSRRPPCELAERCALPRARGAPATPRRGASRLPRCALRTGARGAQRGALGLRSSASAPLIVYSFGAVTRIGDVR